MGGIQKVQMVLVPWRGPTVVAMWLLCWSQKSKDSWVDVGSSARDQKCVVGGGGCVDQGELADRYTKAIGAVVDGTAVPVLEVGPCPDSGQKYTCLVDGMWQVQYYGESSRAATAEAGGGVDNVHTSFNIVDDMQGERLGGGSRVWCRHGWHRVQGGCGSEGGAD